MAFTIDRATVFKVMSVRSQAVALRLRGVSVAFCNVEHVGMVISGVATAAFADGRVTEMKPGDLFYVPPEPHDSWVVGDEPYVSLHFLGASKYAK